MDLWTMYNKERTYAIMEDDYQEAYFTVISYFIYRFFINNLYKYYLNTLFKHNHNQLIEEDYNLIKGTIKIRGIYDKEFESHVLKNENFTGNLFAFTIDDSCTLTLNINREYIYINFILPQMINNFMKRHHLTPKNIKSTDIQDCTWNIKASFENLINAYYREQDILNYLDEDVYALMETWNISLDELTQVFGVNPLELSKNEDKNLKHNR